MAIDISDYVCEFCGKPCTQIVFAAFLCDSPECMEKAYIARGGPGGHMNAKMTGRPIIPENLEETAEEFNRENGEKRDGARSDPVLRV